MGYGNSKRAVVLTGIVLLTVGLAGCMDAGEGSASVFVKDADTDNFESIEVTFTQVSVHRGEDDESEMSGAQHQDAGGGQAGSRPNTDAAGWEVVFEGTKTIDLMEFNESDSRAFLGDANLSAGTYNQILIDVQSVIGTKNDGSTVEFTVTTGWAKVAGAWQVEEGMNTNLVIDVNLERSIVEQGNGDWRFNPVIGRVISERTDEPDRQTMRDDGTGDGTDDTDSSQTSTGAQTTYVKDQPEHNFTQVWVDFDEVEVHYAGNDSWITTVNESRSLDLMSFNETGSKAFLGESELQTGRYTQIRVNVTDAWGIRNDGTNASFDLVNTSYKTSGTWNILENATTQVTIDIDLNKAIHKKGGPGGQGDQGYQFTPHIGQILVEEDVDDDPRADQADSGEA